MSINVVTRLMRYRLYYSRFLLDPRFAVPDMEVRTEKGCRGEKVWKEKYTGKSDTC